MIESTDDGCGSPTMTKATKTGGPQSGDGRSWITPGGVIPGDAAQLMLQVQPESVALSVWSPPYNVGKDYESHLSTADWEALLSNVIRGHGAALKPGGFCAINIADILCYPDESMPKIQAETISRRRISLTREEVIHAMAELGTTDRRKIGAHLGVSEQTVDRRLKGNNIRGGKYQTQTRVRVVGGMIEQFASEAGLFMYDRRIWVKDPAWANSRWHTSSLRAIDEFEYIYILWKPGITKVDRTRLSDDEWRSWGSRGVWSFPSVRSNNDHEAKFPLELPTRLIRLLTDAGDVVLDPFAGSGTSLVAAARLGRIPMGFELDAQYAALSASALRAELSRGEQSSMF